jgi:hypothetical protein
MGERWRTFWVLVCGVPLFLAAFFLPPFTGAAAGLEFIVYPGLFGLPWLAREFRRRVNLPLVLYFLLWVPIAHYVAVVAAGAAYGDIMHPRAATWAAGLAGGLAGGALSLLPFLWPRLRAPEASPLLIGVGAIVLALIGGIGLYDVDGPAGLFALYVPWQIGFAYFLSRLLRPSPPRLRSGEVDGIAPAS